MLQKIYSWKAVITVPVTFTQVHAILSQDGIRRCGRKIKPMWGRVITHYV
jgi:hypothetical protein